MSLPRTDLENADPGDPRVVQLILERINNLTPDQWKERLEWTPVGLEHKRICVSIEQHADVNASNASVSFDRP